MSVLLPETNRFLFLSLIIVQRLYRFDRTVCFMIRDTRCELPPWI